MNRRITKSTSRFKPLGGRGVCQNPDSISFPKERHGIVLDKGKNFGCKANFMGPQTRLDLQERVQSKPINDIDFSSKVHDFAYDRIGKEVKSGKITKKEGMKKIHKADADFINSKTTDDPITSKIAKTAMKAKVLAEKTVLPTKIFSGIGIMEDPMMSLKLKTGIEKEQNGGLAPLLVGILASIASSLAEKGLSALFKKVVGSKGEGKESDMDDEDKRAIILQKFKELPQTQQSKIIKEYI